MKKLLSAVALALALIAAGSPAWAENYPVKDGRGSLQWMASKVTSTLGTLVHHPLNVMEGLFNGVPKPVAVDNDGNIGVTCVSGCTAGGGSLSAQANAATQASTEGATTDPLSMDLSRNLRVIVANSAFAATQSGTWNLNNITGSITLPTGAATSAKQPALGVAGTASTDVITVQGITSMIPLKVDGSGVTQPVSGTVTATGPLTDTQLRATAVPVSGTVTANIGTVGTLATAANQTSVIGAKAAGTAATNSLLAGGVYNSAGITLTNGQQASLQFDSAGGLKVSGAGGGTQFAEDAAHTTGDLGTMMLGVRADTAAALAGTTGDYMPMIFDSSGRQWTRSIVLSGDNAVEGTTSDTSSSSTMFGALLAIKAAANDTTTPSPVKIDQTTPGTTNGVRADTSGATAAAVPSRANYTGVVSGGNLVGLIQADSSAKVSISTNTTTQVVALSSGKKIYVTNFNLHSAGTTTAKFVYGTGTNCGTGTTDLTDVYDFTASDGMVVGNGIGPVLVVPASNAICIVDSAAIHVGGSLAYTQF